MPVLNLRRGHFVYNMWENRRTRTNCGALTQTSAERSSVRDSVPPYPKIQNARNVPNVFNKTEAHRRNLLKVKSLPRHETDV